MKTEGIKRTSDYSIFRRMNGNRGVDEKRVRGLVKSIQKIGWISNPIIVNEKMEIIDGQGRFEALRRLGMPVEYRILKNTGLEVCQVMNSHNTAWKTSDFVDSYADTGNENYQRLRQLSHMYKAPLETILWAAGYACNGKTYDYLKNGGLELTKAQYDAVIKKMDIYEKYYPAFAKIGGQRRTKEKVIFFLIDYGEKHSDFDHGKMIATIAAADPHAMNTHNFDRLLESVQEAWNFNRRKFKLYFYEEYRIDQKIG